MEPEKQKIADLDESNLHKAVLTKLVKPMKTAEIAVELGIAYPTASQVIQIWMAKKYVVRIHTVANRILYKLNEATLEV